MYNITYVNKNVENKNFKIDKLFRMQRYDGKPSEISVFYDTNFGSCISSGTTKEVHTKIVEA